MNPPNTIFDAVDGSHVQDPVIVKDKEQLPFTIVGTGHDGKTGPVEVVSPIIDENMRHRKSIALVLGKMRRMAEDYLEHPVTKAVNCSRFNDARRAATKAAGAVAGLDVRASSAEPTAAAIAYGLERRKSRGGMFVFDLGGGTDDLLSLERFLK